ncbi:MAG: hypothetical protein LBK41_05235, partial [Clostridiales bacterium]|nr:hypothetical protein [Clostridiales bacterium]
MADDELDFFVEYNDELQELEKCKCQLKNHPPNIIEKSPTPKTKREFKRSSFWGWVILIIS